MLQSSFTSELREDAGHFDRVIVDGARHQKTSIFWSSLFKALTQSGAENKKHPASGNSEWGNLLLMRKAIGEHVESFKLTGNNHSIQ